VVSRKRALLCVHGGTECAAIRHGSRSSNIRAEGRRW
jgi:hypothetical protein